MHNKNIKKCFTALRWTSLSLRLYVGVSMHKMKQLLFIFGLIYSDYSFAAFSAFEVVTSASQHAQNLNITGTYNPESGKCTLSFDAINSAWLVTTSRPLSKQEQHLRDYAWGIADKPTYIEIFSKLSATESENPEYSISINKEEASTSYVYVDFYQMVFDGGFYYSIPFNEHCD